MCFADFLSDYPRRCNPFDEHGVVGSDRLQDLEFSKRPYEDLAVQIDHSPSVIEEYGCYGEVKMDKTVAGIGL